MMYTDYSYVIKNAHGKYLQAHATMTEPIWGSLDTAMYIRHYIGAITIQEVTGGTVFQLNRKRQELNFVCI